MEIKNETEEIFEKMHLEELEKIFNKDDIDLNNKNNVFLKCQLSEQEAIDGCTKKIKFMQICENGKIETNEIDVKIPQGIKNASSIVCYGQGNYIKEQNKRSNVIIKVEIK